MKKYLIILCLFLFFPLLTGAENDHLLIVEVQIAGEKANNDFIKIYNPTDSDLDISGYKLRKRSSTGGESSIRVFPEGWGSPRKYGSIGCIPELTKRVVLSSFGTIG